MTERKVRMAVVGVGHWGRNHVKTIKGLEEAELVAICDRDKQRADEISKMYKVKAYYDVEELLEEEASVEAVCVCTSPLSLANVARKVLESGRHVLVEKPMAVKPEDALELIKIAKRKNLVLAVGFIERFAPSVDRLKCLISENRLGDIVFLNSRRVSGHPLRKDNVGVVKDLAIHDVDLSCYILNAIPEAVYARVHYIHQPKGGLEDYALIVLSFPGGRTACIEAGWLPIMKVRRIRVIGDKSSLAVYTISQEIRIDAYTHEGNTCLPPESWVVHKRCLVLPRRWEEPLKLELRHFIECVREGREPRASGVDGYIALSICELALESARTGKAISIRERLGDKLRELGALT